MRDPVVSLHRRLTRARRLFAYAGPDAQDALALEALAPLNGSFLPWTVFSMRPSAILCILTDIVVNSRSQIVECGSGNSTVFMGRLLASHGATQVQVHSLEHDIRWAEVTRQALKRESLDSFVSVVTAPLVNGWYDWRAVPPLDDIDLLVVDGPPAHEQSLFNARAPALTHFGSALRDGATVFLDDAERDGERQVIAQWEREHGLQFHQQRGSWAVATR